MTVPILTTTGLLPAGVHNCTLQDVEAAFCTSERRREIWEGLTEFLLLLKHAVPRFAQTISEVPIVILFLGLNVLVVVAYLL